MKGQVVVLQQLGVAGGIITAILLVIRYVHLVIISLWSMRADKAGRQHALDLIRALKPSFRSS